MFKLSVFVVFTMLIIMTLDPVLAKEGKPIDSSAPRRRTRRSPGGAKTDSTGA